MGMLAPLPAAEARTVPVVAAHCCSSISELPILAHEMLMVVQALHRLSRSLTLCYNRKQWKRHAPVRIFESNGFCSRPTRRKACNNPVDGG
jgi:fumarate reductase subunit D